MCLAQGAIAIHIEEGATRAMAAAQQLVDEVEQSILLPLKTRLQDEPALLARGIEERQ